ncbi:hypothetical protein JZ751_025767 [Albula glossodonta]|uniref:Ig-like domain-containing protein n=1 Tax=Albula glossodonta TaxID=121402 RepID=A0A8T2MV76_9TELE|nr:hypothetical protein JZ751_003615 [Albula glossodonta]KAG9330309.1 hypothetical protein JZ751_025767 [Albula glossodonta]
MEEQKWVYKPRQMARPSNCPKQKTLLPVLSVQDLVSQPTVPVSQPNATVIKFSTALLWYPCQLLCTVDNGTAVTLSWYKEGKKKSRIYTPPFDAPLQLSGTVHAIGNFTCEAKNSISNKTVSITVGAECEEGSECLYYTKYHSCS